MITTDSIMLLISHLTNVQLASLTLSTTVVLASLPMIIKRKVAGTKEPLFNGEIEHDYPGITLLVSRIWMAINTLWIATTKFINFTDYTTNVLDVIFSGSYLVVMLSLVVVPSFICVGLFGILLIPEQSASDHQIQAL